MLYIVVSYDSQELEHLVQYVLLCTDLRMESHMWSVQ